MLYSFRQYFFFFFFNDTATTEIYTLSLHDALPILLAQLVLEIARQRLVDLGVEPFDDVDRKSTRLNSSHGYISYAVFCLKKKNRGDGHARTLRRAGARLARGHERPEREGVQRCARM